MKDLLSRLDETDSRAFDALKWVLSLLSAAITLAFVSTLEVS